MQPRPAPRAGARSGLSTTFLTLGLGGAAPAAWALAQGAGPRVGMLSLLLASLALALIGGVLLFRRLSSERDAAAALAAEKAAIGDRLSAVFDGLADGIIVQDEEGRLVHANEAAARAIGLSSARELLATPVPDILSRFEVLDQRGEPFPLERLPGRLAARGEQPAPTTLRWRERATGAERWSHTRATPVRDPDGRVRYAITVFQDITEERWKREASSMLAEISQELLASSLDYEGTLHLLADLVVPRLADIASVYVVREGVPRRVQIVHRDRESQADVLRIASGAGAMSIPDHPVNRVIASGRPLLLPEIPDRAVLGEETLRGLRPSSAMILPLSARGEVLGALVLVTTGDRRRYDEKDLEVASDLAGRAAVTVENARLHREEQEARHAAEATVGRMGRLQRVTSSLTAASRVEEVGEALVSQAEATMGASLAFVMLREGRTLRLLADVGLTEETRERWNAIPLDTPVPVAEAARTGEAVLFPGLEDLREAYAHLAEAAEPDGKAWAALPLLSTSGEILGVIGLGFAEPRPFPEEERSFLRIVSEQCAQALERARLFEAEHEARSQAVLQQERLNFLAEAGEILSGSLRYEQTIEDLLKLCVPRMADWCMIDLLEPDGSISLLSVAHADPQKADLIRELRRRYPLEARDHPVSRVIETGSPEMAAEIREEELRARTVDERHLRLLRELGVAAHMIVPLIARQRTIGAISFVSGSSARRYTPADLALAEILGRRTALALDNARLYRERSQLARSLQQSLLPDRLPQIPGLEVAARYRPAPEGDVGGDFYDVFELPHGRWAFVIGDVSGKGPQAAALTALARHTIRTAWLEEGREPEGILALLHAVMLKERTDRYCTLLLASLDLSTRPHRIVFAGGGHPPPLLLRSDGSIQTLRVPGMLVGALADAEFGRLEASLGSGETLLLYTDGIGDAGRPSQVPIEDRLAELLRLCGGLDAELTANRMERHAASFEGASDDAALLVARVLPD